MTNTNVSQEKLTSTRCEEDELEVIENGGLSPHPSLRTEDDACSEIIRIEQGGSQERDPEQNTTLERIVRTLQVSDQFESCGIFWIFESLQVSDQFESCGIFEFPYSSILVDFQIIFMLMMT